MDLVDFNGPKTKTEIRNHLRSIGKEKDFTKLQGEVYGPEIVNAEAAVGVLEALKKLKMKEVEMHLISHKTKYPYLGPKYDLHSAATKWLDKNGFFRENEIGWDKSQVNYMATKEEKINKILELKCTHYVDDLPEILNMLPGNIQKILYDPNGQQDMPRGMITMKKWSDLSSLLHENNT